VLVGQFTQVSGSAYYRIVRLLPTGALDTTINFGDGANSDVDAAVIQPADGMIVIGGAFTQFEDQPYDHLVRLYGGSAGGSGGGGYGVVIPAGSALVQEGFQPPNNVIDPGETNTLSFAFREVSGNNLTNLVATLLVTNGITYPSPASNSYGSLIVGGPSVSRQFSFTASGTNGQTIAATFLLQNGTNNLGLGVFTYTLGTLTNTFANTNLIVINDNTNATPYPSTINVSGVGGTLIKITVTFANLTHTWPRDIDALLESPYQQSTLLMAHAGGGNPVKGVTLTFDDAASTNLPQAGQIVSGTYNPTVYFPVPTFPAPAPSIPYATNLSNFIGSNPNGTWSLFVIDDTSLNVGAISNGWSLNVITASPIASLPPQFGGIVSSNGTFQFTITGKASSTIIQASTNLVSGIWVNLYTNTPPFTFTDSNASNYRYRFYRAIPAP
jgi:subtilisin-like proprotein convertase family protein